VYRVIIVEDDPMVAAIDKQYVEMDPAFRVVQICKNGQEGLDYLARNEVDLIILDYYTPRLTGEEFVDQLRNMGKTTAIIMVTSANDTTTIQNLLARGVLDYLVKPFQYARFHQALARFHQAERMLDREKGSLDQQDIDQLLRGRSPAGPAQGVELEKGMNLGTLDLVRQFFASHPGEPFTSEQVSEQVGLSRITVRRYVNFMADKGEIVSSINYQTGGRPAIRYFTTER
jgi:CitB family two-component system response regulator MalR/two-component system response regulator DctR